jgi:hypothetical protein
MDHFDYGFIKEMFSYFIRGFIIHAISLAKDVLVVDYLNLVKCLYVFVKSLQYLITHLDYVKH